MTCDPSELYKITARLGRGAFGAVFKAVRKTDQKTFALKFTNPRDSNERRAILSECSLMMHLNSDNLVRCEEVYDYQNRIWIFLEYMEGNALCRLVEKRNGDFTEDFVRWSLHQVALGLQCMHA